MSRHHLLKSAFWLTISEIIFNLSGYVVHSGVGRILGPADYGRYGIVVTLTTMVVILIGQGIPTAMSKYLSEVFISQPQEIKAIKRQTILTQIAIIGAITLLFFLSIPLLARALGDPSLIPLFRISTLIIPAFAAASFYFYYFTGLHQFHIQSILKVTRSIAKVIAIIGLAYFIGTAGAVAGYIIAPLFVFVVAILIDKFYTAKKIKASQKEAQTKETFTWKKLLKYAWPLTLFLIFYELLITIDLYLVKGILQSDYLTGIYNGAITVGRLPYYLFYALTIIMLPTISKSTSENNHEETFKLINQSLRFMLLMLVPGVVLMTIFAGPIIQIFYGSQFSDAVPIMQIVVWGVAFLTIFYVMSFVFNGAGKPKTSMWIALGGLILNIVLNYIFIKQYGLMGSAVAISITSFITMLASLIYIKKYFEVSLKFSSVFLALLGGFAIYGLSSFISTDSILSILWSIPLLLIYAFILFIFREITKEDLEIFKSLLSRKKG